MNDVINLQKKFAKFDASWVPYIIGEFDNVLVKVLKATKEHNGEVPWHAHTQGDEFCLVIKGEITVKFRDREVTLREGECMIIPKGVEHCPATESEVQLLIIESKDVVSAGTKVPHELERI